MHKARLTKPRERMAAKGLDGFLVTEIANVFYLSGFTGDTGTVLVTKSDSYLLVDPRFTVQANSECKSAKVVEYSKKNGITAAAELVNDLKLARVGYESDNLTVASLRQLRRLVDPNIKLRSTSGTVEKLRRTKDAHEISLIQSAAGIADAAFESILLEIRLGMTEKDVALLIDSTLRKMGADKEAFDTIAACGSNSACPHHSPTDAVLQRGQFLKMDFGARSRKYNSDITRTICLGEPTARQREVYGIVLDAQLRAIDAIKPGEPGKSIDAVARDFITSKGYGDNFGHGLGHGLGIAVHDHPALAQTSDLVLAPGMVVTVEPGIYIEDWGGVRIEDDVLVTDTGAEVLTKASKILTSLVAHDV